MISRVKQTARYLAASELVPIEDVVPVSLRPNLRSTNTPLTLIACARCSHSAVGVAPLFKRFHTVACRSLTALYSIYQSSRSANI